jgi:phage-related protein
VLCDAQRVIYVARFADAVYVLHAFQKKSQKTAREDIVLAAQRYREVKAISDKE